MGGPASCEACSCGDAAIEECAGVAVSIFSQEGCGGIATSFDAEFVKDSCQFVSSQTGTGTSISVTPGTPFGSCAAQGGNVLQLPEATPSGASSVCEGEVFVRDTCGEGGGCAETPSQPFAPVYCIAAQGSVSCPAGWPTKVSLYESWDDTRGCKDCECGIADGTCTAFVQAWAGDVCGEGIALGEFGSNTCKSLGNGAGAGISLETVEIVGEASCAVTNQGPTGSLVPITETTVCCAGG
jgi:hypothetical protein